MDGLIANFAKFQLFYYYFSVIMEENRLGEIMQKRISYLDVLKGIGIILVVFGHSGVTNKYLYSFHMPLFFLISGFLFNSFKTQDFIPFIKKKTKTILIPYFSFTVISIIIMAIINKAFEPNLISEIFFWDGEVFKINTPLWFLLVLFLVEVIYYLVFKITTRPFLIVSLLLFSVVGFFISINTIRLPFGIDIAFIAIVFYGVGNVLKQQIQQWLDNSSIKRKILVVIILSIVNVLAVYLNNGITMVSMYSSWYGNYFYFYIGAFAGIFILYLVAYVISSSRILEYLGRNSLIIMSTHYMVINLVNSIIPFDNLTGSMLLYLKGGIYTLITVVLAMPLIYLINNFVPFIIGKPYPKRTQNISINKSA